MGVSSFTWPRSLGLFFAPPYEHLPIECRIEAGDSRSNGHERDDRRATTGRRETYVRMVAASAANGSRVVILRPLPKGRSQHIEGCGRDHEFFRLWVEGCGRLAGGARCSN